MLGKNSKLALLVGCILLFFCPHSASAQGAKITDLRWRDYQSEPGGYTVRFPAAPVLKDDTFQKGPLTLTRHIQSADLRDVYFEVDWMELPVGVTDPALNQEGGISGIKHTVETSGGRLLTNQAIVRGNCEGREATFSAPAPGSSKPGYMQVRMFNSGQRIYVVVVGGDDDGATIRAIALTFLDSFSVTGGCKSMVTPVTAPSIARTEERVSGEPDAATGWRRIESTELGFSVLMPAAATHETVQQQVQPFPIMHHGYGYQTEGAAFLVEVVGEYPSGFRSTEVSFQTGLDLTYYLLKKELESTGLVLSLKRELRVGIFPGREYSLTGDKVPLSGLVQTYVTAKRIYTFMAFAADDPKGRAAVNRFFASVKVTPG